MSHRSHPRQSTNPCKGCKIVKQTSKEVKVGKFIDAMQQRSDDLRGTLLLVSELLREEHWEVQRELGAMQMDLIRGVSPDLEQWLRALEELVDLQYVLSGAVDQLGYTDVFDEAFNRKHLANLSKLGDDGLPIKNEYGKVIKGPNYMPADMSDLI